MKQELKTLKDFVTKPIYLDFDRKPTTNNASNLAYCGGCNGDFLEAGCNCGLADSEKLKQESIKWIKHIQEDIKQLQNIESKPQSHLGKMATNGLDEILEGQIKWIKMFFNIEEKEVK